MTVIRFFGAGMLKLLLIISIFTVMLASLTMHFTQKEVLSPIIGELAFAQLQQNSPDQLIAYTELMQVQCDNEKTETISLKLGEVGETVNCTNLKINQENEIKIVLARQFEVVFDKSKDIQCNGYECLTVTSSEEDLLSGNLKIGLLSQAFTDFLNKIKTIAIMCMLFSIVALMLVLESWSKRFTGIGFPLLINGLPYFFLGYLQTKVMEIMPDLAKSLGEKVLGEVFAYLSNALLGMLVIGIILVIVGLVLKYTSEKEDTDD